MLAAVLSLTVLGAVLGVVLGVANRFLQVEGNPLVDEVLEMMPGSNCGQCGFPGCSGAASALVDGSAAATVCPPGGKALASALAAKLGLSLDLSGMDDSGPKLAAVAEELCIGCCRCAKVCPTDAIVGAAPPDSQRAARSLHRLRKLRAGVPHRSPADEADAGHPATLGDAAPGRRGLNRSIVKEILS